MLIKIVIFYYRISITFLNIVLILNILVCSARLIVVLAVVLLTLKAIHIWQCYKTIINLANIINKVLIY